METNRPADMLEAEHRVILNVVGAMAALAEALEGGKPVEARKPARHRGFHADICGQVPPREGRHAPVPDAAECAPTLCGNSQLSGAMATIARPPLMSVVFMISFLPCPRSGERSQPRSQVPY